MNRQEVSKQIVILLRWLARAGSLLSVGVLLLFVIGDEMEPGQITSAEWLALFFFPFGITVGMLLAWRWETLGGTITVLSLLAFYTVMYSANGRFPEGIWFMLFSLPGLIFLYCGLRSSNSQGYLRAI